MICEGAGMLFPGELADVPVAAAEAFCEGENGNF